MDEQRSNAPEDEVCDEGSHGQNFFASVVLTVNMVLGAGVVGLPYAFFHAGAWLSVACMTLATLFATATMGYIVEVSAWTALYKNGCEQGAMYSDDHGQEDCGRLEGARSIRRGTESERVGRSDGERRAERGREARAEEGRGRCEPKAVGEHEGAGVTEDQDESARESARAEGDIMKRTNLEWRANEKFEISEMCGVFLGLRVRRLVEVSLFCYTMGSCWLYATIFSSSLLLVVPLPLRNQPLSLSWCMTNCEVRDEWSCSGACVWTNVSNSATSDNATSVAGLGICNVSASVMQYCGTSYRAFLLLFALMMGTCVCLDLSKLKFVQFGMSGVALCSLLAMIVTCLVATKNDSGEEAAWRKLPETNWGGFGKLVTAAMFSQLCHQGVPTLMGSMKKQKDARNVFRLALCITLLIYVLLCFTTNYYFGPRILPIITLNWQDYTDGARVGMPISFWARVIQYSVLCFPVFTVSAAFPLNMLPLSETLYKLLPAALTGGEVPPAVFAVPNTLSTSAVETLRSGGETLRDSLLAEAGGIEERRANESASAAEEAGTQERTSGVKLLLRIFLAMVPIGLAAVVRDVGKILEFNGLFAFIISFFVPCTLHIAARSACVRRFGIYKAHRTPYYSFPSSSTWCVVLILLSSIGLAVFTLIQVLRDVKVL